MNKTELINKLLWLGYTSAEEGTEKRKEAVSLAHNLVDEYLEQLTIHSVVKSFYCQREKFENKEYCKEQCITCFSKSV